jgi:hypothetical protein
MGERDIVVAMALGGGLFAWRIFDGVRTGVLKGPPGLRGAEIRRSERPIRFKVDLWILGICAGLCFLGALLLAVFLIRRGG